MLSFIIVTLLFHFTNAKRIICYTTNWSQYRSDSARFTPEDIDPFLCTHIIYSFVKVNGTKLVPIEWNDESSESMIGMYERTTNLKIKNPRLKVLIAVGGANFDNKNFEKIVYDDFRLEKFANNSIEFLLERKFDGLDIDWEYPVGHKDGFNKLLMILKKKFEEKNLLLTAAVAASKENIESSYELSFISKYIDFLNVMTYDYHGSWENSTGHVAPLYSRMSEDQEQQQYNVNYTISYYLDNGFPSEKINLGFACYGKSFTLEEEDKVKFGSAAIGGGHAGKYTKDNGTLAYYEICDRFKENWNTTWDDEHKVPFAFKDNQFVGYENYRSLRQKIKYLSEKKLGGIMFWSMDMDDFSGSFCKKGKYPMVKTTKNLYLSKKNIKPRKKMINHCVNGDGIYIDLKDGCQHYFTCEQTKTSSFKSFQIVEKSTIN
ncbi:chitotriosidase-1 isoform X1 [Brachionus plicatilis]|uniref:Chitotriosidase-1 isoform X1 n=1 Tax=Brachionus plicatilis TaxID=10195 RepID=A0A3M7PAK0_BRAPC|nr:chitotriosidase-1 isoform X1 [Brachionus plicatilis]